MKGPKWVGKTSSCEQLAKSALYMRDPDEYEANMEAALIRPSLLLEGAKNLNTIVKKVDTSKTGLPSFRAVITGGKYAYRRPDGVLVIPLACLRD